MKAYHFGDRLKYFRKTAGLTQAALAEKVGISTHHVTQIERGLTLPGLNTFIKLCKALDAPADSFLMDDDVWMAQNACILQGLKVRDLLRGDNVRGFEILHLFYRMLTESTDAPQT